MKKPLIFRQGDCMLRQIETIPTFTKAKTNVLAEGEGHHNHEVYGDLQVFEDATGLYLSVNSKGVLEHNHIGTRNLADHNPIELPKGNYEVIIQRQYNPYEKAIEQVRD